MFKMASFMLHIFYQDKKIFLMIMIYGFCCLETYSYFLKMCSSISLGSKMKYSFQDGSL